MGTTKIENPIGGKRSAKGKGRGRESRLTLWLSQSYADALARFAEEGQVTRTAVIERGIELYAREHGLPPVAVPLTPKGDATPPKNE